jgi:hypothetical protein
MKPQRNWTVWSAIGTIVLIAALAVGFISVSRTWFFASYPCLPNQVPPCPLILSRSGLDTAAGWLYLFVLLNVALLYVVRSLAGKQLVLPLADWWLYLLGGVGALGAASQSLRDPAFHDSVGFGFGFLLALAAAAAICLSALFKRTLRQKTGWSTLGAVLVIGLGVLYGVGLILLFTISPPV